jgi:hypothetical protein
MSETYTSPFVGRVPKRVPPVAERVWELRREGKWARGGIVYHSDPLGFGFQFYVEGHFIEGRRFGYRDAAIEYGDKIRGEYRREGGQRRLQPKAVRAAARPYPSRLADRASGERCT